MSFFSFSVCLNSVTRLPDMASEVVWILGFLAVCLIQLPPVFMYPLLFVLTQLSDSWQEARAVLFPSPSDRLCKLPSLM